MCRSIKKLRGIEPPVSSEDIQSAARQYVRKVSGYRIPSKANQAAFESAVQEVAAATQRLLESLKS